MYTALHLHTWGSFSGVAESYNTWIRESSGFKNIHKSGFCDKSPLSINIEVTSEDKTSYVAGELDRRKLAAAYYRFEIMSEVR